MRCVEPFADGGDNARNVAESVLEPIYSHTGSYHMTPL